MTQHSKFSPSAAYRWLNCNGSLQYRSSGTSAAAEEGTAKHNEAAQHLQNDTDSDCEHVQVYLDYVRSLPGLKYIETKVILQSVSNQIFGTADYVAVNPFIKLAVVDFKFGSGIEVEAANNPQLAIYAYAAWETLLPSVDKVDLVIVQPRSPSGQKIKVWQTTIKELKPYRDRVASVYKDTITGYYHHTPGDWCHWCPGASDCPAILEALPALAKPDSLDQIDKMVKILNAKKGILEAYKQLETRVKGLISQGVEVPGYKLVQSWGHRVWKDEEKVHKKVGKKKATKTVTLGPAQIEKANPELKTWVAENTYKPNRGLTLVPESDKRKPASLVDALPKLED